MASGPLFVPDWVFDVGEYSDQLLTFLRNPKRTLLTILLSAFVSVVLDIFEPILDAISLVFFGDSVTTTEGAIGLTDVPLIILNQLSAGAREVAGIFVDDGLIAGIGSWVSDLVGSTGFLAYPLTVAVTVSALVVATRLVEAGGVAVVESIPVVGPFILNVIGK